MKQTLKNLFCLAILASSTAALADSSCGDSGSCGASASGPSTECCFPAGYMINDKGNVYGQTNFTAHPVQWDMFRRMAGASTEKLHLFGEEEFYGVASLALQYQQTTDNGRIAQWFSFNNSGANNGAMTYGPAASLDDALTEIDDINSLNFGVTNSGTVTFCPKIQNFVADIDLFFGWDEFVCGLSSRFSIPINWTRWTLGLNDSNAGTGATTFPNGLYNAFDAATAVDVPYTSLKDAWKGTQPFGAAPVLKKGRIDGSQSETAVAGLKMELGYDFLRRDKSHLALSFLVVAPTGNKPNATYLFDAISGSSKSWEIGADFNGHWNFWERQECNQSLGLHFDVALVSQLKSSQTRLFGMKNGGDQAVGENQTTPAACNVAAGSSWLLLKQVSDGAAGNNAPTVTGLERAANVLALQAKIGAGFETNGAILLKYIRNHFSVDLGYELYYRSQEKLSSRATIDPFTYGVYGASLDNTGSLAASYLTGASSSTSTIGKPAFYDYLNDVQTFVYLQDSDVCACTALQPATLSNKVFGFCEYSWDNCDWDPTVGLGASYEIGASKSGAKNVALNQWSVLAKGSISF